jgi:hypothetical protein
MAQGNEEIDWAERARDLEAEADRLKRERSTRDDDTSTAERLKEDLAGPLETLRKVAEK